MTDPNRFRGMKPLVTQEMIENLKHLNESAMKISQITERPLGEPGPTGFGPYSAHELTKHGQPSDLDRLKATFDAMGVKYETGNCTVGFCPPKPGKFIGLKDPDGDRRPWDFLFDADGKLVDFG